LSQSRSPATVRKIHRVLSLLLAMAIKDGCPARNVASGVNLPRVVEAERQYLTHDEAERLARDCAYCGREIVSKHRRLSDRHREDYRLIVLLLAYTGMRFGEFAALRAPAGLRSAQSRHRRVRDSGQQRAGGGYAQGTPTARPGLV
jgi:integrase